MSFNAWSKHGRTARSSGILNPGSKLWLGLSIFLEELLFSSAVPRVVGDGGNKFAADDNHHDTSVTAR